MKIHNTSGGIDIISKKLQLLLTSPPQVKAEEESQGEAGVQCGTGGSGAGGSTGDPSEAKGTPKRLHVSNIPFRFRDPDLRQMFGVRSWGGCGGGGRGAASGWVGVQRQTTE